jgi:hypothetical protein
VLDYIFLGSNAAYNYTEHSDIDLHVLVDLTSLKDDPAVIKRLYNYIKNDLLNKYTLQTHMNLATGEVHFEWIPKDN